MNFKFERYIKPNKRRTKREHGTLALLEIGQVAIITGFNARLRARQMIITRLKKHHEEVYSWAETPNGDYAIRKDAP